MTKRPAAPRRASSRKPGPALSDDALLDLVQRQTFQFFWDAAHPVSGLIPDRTDRAGKAPNDWVTTGGSGFGIMAMIVAVERGWIARAAAVERLMTIVRHLERTTSHHGVFPHFLDGRTGATVSFSRKDDGGDIVETAFLKAIDSPDMKQKMDAVGLALKPMVGAAYAKYYADTQALSKKYTEWALKQR